MKRKLIDWMNQWGLPLLLASIIPLWDTYDTAMRWILSWGFFWSKLPHPQSLWVPLGIDT